MALTIVRNDITRMEVDAIVNSTNEHFVVGGLGVDAGIHAAAGPRLQEALSEIGFCPVGSSVITPSFGISSCRYIIHTVGPRYLDGMHGERQLLRSCYRSILSLAREKGCRSLAVPSISSGAYGYPKAEAYALAASCIREFLLSLPEDEDMMVYLVLFDRESVAVSEKIDSGVRHFISDAYPGQKKEALQSSRENITFRRRKSHRTDKSVSFNALPSAPLPDFTASMAESPSRPDYRDQDRSFAEMCEWWCERKGISKNEFYKKANINKALFWGMKHHPHQVPKKTNALACAVGLRLDYEQTQDLLSRAGLTLSKYYDLDLVVEYFIRERNYNIDEINAVLFDRDLALLGSF
ncbi:MAG: macro domain-containing protein [Oscillospiraceae bacterium]|nr:macro domain-containing protein [Oscillospiraceae bacterium]